MEDFYNFGFIKNIVDIYNLKNHKQDLIRLEGFGDKSVNNLLDAIEESKANSLERLIFALGISNVGEKTAKVLAMEFDTLDKLMEKTEEELLTISDIGDIIAKSIVEYFENQENRYEIDALKMNGVNMSYTGDKIQKADEFFGKTFVITGTLEHYTREEVEERIELLGGKASSSVSKKTSALILGANPGSKYEKALSLGVAIWDEEKLIEMFDKYQKR